MNKGERQNQAGNSCSTEQAGSTNQLNNAEHLHIPEQGDNYFLEILEKNNRIFFGIRAMIMQEIDRFFWQTQGSETLIPPTTEPWKNNISIPSGEMQNLLLFPYNFEQKWRREVGIVSASILMKVMEATEGRYLSLLDSRSSSFLTQKNATVVVQQYIRVVLEAEGFAMQKDVEASVLARLKVANRMV